MQPQFSTLLTLAEGTSIVTDDIFDNRFRYVAELRRMALTFLLTARWLLYRALASSKVLLLWQLT